MNENVDRLVEFVDDLDYDPTVTEIRCPSCGDVDAAGCDECQGMGTVFVLAADLE